MTARTGKDGKQRFTFHEDELAQLKKVLNGSKNGWIYKTIGAVIIFFVTICLVGSAWAGIIQIPALKARLVNSEQEIGYLRSDVGVLADITTELKVRLELFLDGQK